LTVTENLAQLVVEKEFAFLIGLEAIMEYGLLPPLRQFSYTKQHQVEVLPSAPLSSCSPATLGAPFVASTHLDDCNAGNSYAVVLPLEFFNVVGVRWCRRSEGISDFLPSDCVAGERVSSTQLPADDSDVTP
jgi:hypothetical protein